MIPPIYIFALVMTLLMAIYKVIPIKDRYLNISINSLGSTITGLIWVAIIVKNFFNWLSINKPIIEFILIVVLGLIAGFLIMMFTLNDSTESTDNNKTIQYTTETLIGLTGVITDVYADNSFLGNLDDEVHSQIVIYLNEHAEKNDKFKSSEIKEGKIYAIKVS